MLAEIVGGVDSRYFKYRDHDKACLHCSIGFVALHARAKFCSPHCGSKHRNSLLTPEQKMARNRFPTIILTPEQEKAKWTRANKKKSDKKKLAKYGTLDESIIASIKKVNGFLRNRKTLSEKPSRPDIRLKSALYRRLNALVRGEARHSHMEEYLGLSFSEFKTYIEQRFEPRMSWANHSRYGWHLDHIKPCSSFDLSTEIGRRECFHYTNLRPLWASENLRKSNKIIDEGE